MNSQGDLASDIAAQLHQIIVQFRCQLKQIVVSWFRRQFAIQDRRYPAHIVQASVNQLFLPGRRVGVFRQSDDLGCFGVVISLKTCKAM